MRNVNHFHLIQKKTNVSSIKCISSTHTQIICGIRVSTFVSQPSNQSPTLKPGLNALQCQVWVLVFASDSLEWYTLERQACAVTHRAGSGSDIIYCASACLRVCLCLCTSNTRSHDTQAAKLTLGFGWVTLASSPLAQILHLHAVFPLTWLHAHCLCRAEDVRPKGHGRAASIAPSGSMANGFSAALHFAALK